jgi:hypothetical protein
VKRFSFLVCWCSVKRDTQGGGNVAVRSRPLRRLKLDVDVAPPLLE